tara:strand:+ start:235 stop:378 length:144 start_codon:yes stop_codon:yes gene_type:complete
MKLKYTQEYLKTNPDKTVEDVKREFLELSDGFCMYNMIEMNKSANRK